MAIAQNCEPYIKMRLDDLCCRGMNQEANGKPSTTLHVDVPEWSKGHVRRT